MQPTLAEQFERLSHELKQLISLLEETEDKFWIAYMRRGLRQVDDRKLAGATFVLGCYGGQDSFSDVVIGAHFETADPLRFRNVNARLEMLRNNIFSAADSIASRRHW